MKFHITILGFELVVELKRVAPAPAPAPTQALVPQPLPPNVAYTPEEGTVHIRPSLRGDGGTVYVNRVDGLVDWHVYRDRDELLVDDLQWVRAGGPLFVRYAS